MTARTITQDEGPAGNFGPKKYPVSRQAVPGAKKMPPGMKAALEKQLNRR